MRARALATVGALLLAFACASCAGSRGGSGTFEARRAGLFASQFTQAELGRVELPPLQDHLEGEVAALALGTADPELAWRVAVLDKPEPLIVGFEGGTC